MKILKKLKPEERGLTRTLWEQVFTEDTKEFLDYYYTEKTKNNEIYVIETDHDIRAMVWNFSGSQLGVNGSTSAIFLHSYLLQPCTIMSRSSAWR